MGVLLCGPHTRVNFSDWILEQEKGCCSINQSKSSYILARHYIQKSSVKKHAFLRSPDIWHWVRKKLRSLECLSETPSPGGLACISQPARFTYRCQNNQHVWIFPPLLFIMMVKIWKKNTGHLATDHHSFLYLSIVLLYLNLQLSDSWLTWQRPFNYNKSICCECGGNSTVIHGDWFPDYW